MSAQRRKSLLKINGDISRNTFGLSGKWGKMNPDASDVPMPLPLGVTWKQIRLSPRSQRKLQALLTVGLEKLP